MGSNRRAVLKFLGWVLGLFALFFGVLRLFFVTPVTVAHNAMAPTFVHGDVVLVWRGTSVDHGDVVVCHHPSQPRYVIGRVLGLDGFSITSPRNQLTINGVRPTRTHGGTMPFFDATAERTYTMNWGHEELGNNDHLFFEQLGRTVRTRDVGSVRGIYLLGDNRAYQDEDSRDFGDVDPTTCIGEVFMRFSPAEGVDLGELPHGWFDIIR